VGLRAGLDWCGKSRPTGIRSPDRPAHRQSLYRLHYPAHISKVTRKIMLRVLMLTLIIVKQISVRLKEADNFFYRQVKLFF